MQFFRCWIFFLFIYGGLKFTSVLHIFPTFSLIFKVLFFFCTIEKNSVVLSEKIEIAFNYCVSQTCCSYLFFEDLTVNLLQSNEKEKW